VYNVGICSVHLDTRIATVVQMIVGHALIVVMAPAMAVKTVAAAPKIVEPVRIAEI
jgi:hypothetical protein